MIERSAWLALAHRLDQLRRLREERNEWARKVILEYDSHDQARVVAHQPEEA